MLDELQKIGLSENEAGVYLALLELGSSTAAQIAQKARVNRATTYVQIETLIRMGLVSTFEKGKKTYFRAEDPEYLKKVIEREKATVVEREQKLTDIMPELEKLFLTASERPRVRFFEGKEGLLTIVKDFLKTKDRAIEAVASLDNILDIFPAHLKDYSSQRVKKGIRSKFIYTSSQGAILAQSDAEMLRESRFVPPEKFPFTCDITIYEHKVAISSLRDRPFGIIIESKEVADSLRALFYLAWDTAGRYEKGLDEK